MDLRARKDPQGDTDALYFTFSLPILQLGFAMVYSSFLPGSHSFNADVQHLLPMLSMCEGVEVERKVLVKCFVEAAKQCGMDWCGNWRDRAALLFGVIHASMIQRRRADFLSIDHVSWDLGRMGLEREEGRLVHRLVDDLADAVDIEV